MPDYVKDEEVKEIALNLVNKFTDLLGHIKPERLLYAREISRSQKTQYGSCRAVKPPFNLLNPEIMYIISIYFRADWDKLENAQKSLLVMHQLLHIGPEFDGVVLPHDASDWAFIIDHFGTNYLERAEVANILDDVQTEI